MIPSQPGLYRPDLHYRGEWPGIHYVAFTKILRDHSRPLGFSSLINIIPLPTRRVTNKSNTKEPRHPASAEQVLCLDPIDGTTAKPTTPHGRTIFPSGHPTNRSLRRGTREIARVP
jgi:hypothetical protein